MTRTSTAGAMIYDKMPACRLPYKAYYRDRRSATQMHMQEGWLLAKQQNPEPPRLARADSSHSRRQCSKLAMREENQPTASSASLSSHNAMPLLRSAREAIKRRPRVAHVRCQNTAERAGKATSRTIRATSRPECELAHGRIQMWAVSMQPVKS